MGKKEDWNIIKKVLPSLMKQSNGCDCGMYVLTFCRDLHALGHFTGDEPPCEEFDCQTMDGAASAALEILTMGIQERINTRTNVTSSPGKRAVLQQVVDVKSPLGKKFYSDSAIEKLPQGTNQTRKHGETNGCLSTFVLVLMKPQQERDLWKYGNRRCIQMDSTFNITKSKFSTFTLIARHPDGFYMPCVLHHVG